MQAGPDSRDVGRIGGQVRHRHDGAEVADVAGRECGSLVILEPGIGLVRPRTPMFTPARAVTACKRHVASAGLGTEAVIVLVPVSTATPGSPDLNVA